MDEKISFDGDWETFFSTGQWVLSEGAIWGNRRGGGGAGEFFSWRREEDLGFTAEWGRLRGGGGWRRVSYSGLNGRSTSTSIN